MYRFALRPRWIVSHVVVAALVVAMVGLGIWQIRRHQERAERNETIEQRTTQAVEPWASAVFGVADTTDGSDVEYTPVTITGTYDTGAEFVVVSRTQDGAPGRWVVTPLRQSDDGPAVLVLRGFAPLVVDDAEPPISGVEPPEGPVTVTGWLRPATSPGAFQPDDSRLSGGEWARIDIDRYRETVEGAVAPVYIQLARQTPATDAPLLTPVPLPELTSGPHIGYAAQWFIFSSIAAVGYVLILRRAARADRGDDSGGAGDADDS